MNHPFGKDFDQLLATPLPEREYFRAICQYVEFNHEEFLNKFLLIDLGEFRNQNLVLSKNVRVYSTVYKLYDALTDVVRSQPNVVIETNLGWNQIVVSIKTKATHGSFLIYDRKGDYVYLGIPKVPTPRPTDEEVSAVFRELAKLLSEK